MTAITNIVWPATELNLPVALAFAGTDVERYCFELFGVLPISYIVR